MWQTILRFGDIHPWLLSCVGAIAVAVLAFLYRISKKMAARMYQLIMRWYHANYDAKLHDALPSYTVRISDFAMTRKASVDKALASLRRLREAGSVFSPSVDGEPEESLWHKC
jgi:hypothetical protein